MLTDLTLEDGWTYRNWVANGTFDLQQSGFRRDKTHIQERTLTCLYKLGPRSPIGPDCYRKTVNFDSDQSCRVRFKATISAGHHSDGQPNSQQADSNR
jgi:hypothetical protein